MVTYDCGVIGEFEHTPPIMKENQNPQVVIVCYIGECKEILELDYGGIEMAILLCSWVQPRTCGPHVGMNFFLIWIHSYEFEKIASNSRATIYFFFTSFTSFLFRLCTRSWMENSSTKGCKVSKRGWFECGSC